MKQTSSKWVLGHHIEPHQTTGNYDLVTGLTPPATMGPPPHYHKKLNEVFIVIQGEMEFFVDGVKKILKQGESINLAPNSSHTFRNATDKECRWVNIHSPKGFLKFFETLGVASNRKDAQEKSLSPEKIQEVLQTAQNYDMILEQP